MHYIPIQAVGTSCSSQEMKLNMTFRSGTGTVLGRAVCSLQCPDVVHKKFHRNIRPCPNSTLKLNQTSSETENCKWVAKEYFQFKAPQANLKELVPSRRKRKLHDDIEDLKNWQSSERNGTDPYSSIELKVVARHGFSPCWARALYNYLCFKETLQFIYVTAITY